MQPTTIAILVALCALCTVYAFVLDRINERYVPNWTWLTVVVGNSFIGAALWAIEAASEPLTFALVVLANVAAGGPIIVWQFVQSERRRQERSRG